MLLYLVPGKDETATSLTIHYENTVPWWKTTDVQNCLLFVGSICWCVFLVFEMDEGISWLQVYWTQKRRSLDWDPWSPFELASRTTRICLRLEKSQGFAECCVESHQATMTYLTRVVIKAYLWVHQGSTLGQFKSERTSSWRSHQWGYQFELMANIYMNSFSKYFYPKQTAVNSRLHGPVSQTELRLSQD